MSYDDYFGKHWARQQGWLPASIDFKNRINKSQVKYLTLCDVEAIDIFMLERAGVLTRDENNFLTNVVICESETDKIPQIFEVTRPPLREAIIQGKLEKLLLFKDDDSTRDIDPNVDEDVRSKSLRDKLLIKKYSFKLIEQFPFDIINFDAYGSLLRPRNELFRSFKRIFELQSEIDTFLLFVTTPINHLEDIENKFKTDFDRNIKDHEEISKQSEETLGTVDYDSIDEYKRVAIGFGKSVIARFSKEFGWKNRHLGIFVYENDMGRHMMSSVIEFSKVIPEEGNNWYVNDIVEIIGQMPEYRSHVDAQRDNGVKGDLQAIIDYREQLQKEYRE